jgi:hypothetical protein
MTLLRIFLSRQRVRRGVRLLRAGRAIIDAEERRWGLADANWCWRVPNTRASRL